MSKPIILFAMVFALCVARVATVSAGSGAEQLMQAEGVAMATPVSQSV